MITVVRIRRGRSRENYLLRPLKMLSRYRVLENPS